MYTSAFQSHMLLYFPSPVQPVRCQTPLFPGIKTFLFKGDGAEIFLNVTLSQMPFKFHPSFHLCCFSLSFLLKKNPFLLPPTCTLHTIPMSFSPSPLWVSLSAAVVACLKAFLFSLLHILQTASQRRSYTCLEQSKKNQAVLSSRAS